MKKNKFSIAILVISLTVIISGCTKSSYLEYREKEADAEVSSQSSDTSEQADESSEASSVFVQVAGAVNNPGVYELKPDSRVYEAIEAAGGLTDDAFDIDLNQAATIEDGQKIYVYNDSEMQEISVAQASPGGVGTESSQLLNINTASEEELTSLSGIGASKARAIVSYRTDNGSFSKTEDIMNVEGIGEGTYSKIKDQITV